jgi:hypothetical protein
MEIISAEQAIKDAKGLTFEIVWAALMENRKQIDKTDKQFEKTQLLIDKTQEQMQRSHEQMQEQMQRTQKETQEQMQRTQRETQEQMQRSHEQMQEKMQESQRKTDKIIADLSKNIGGLGNSLGRLTEALFSAKLWKKFNSLGFPFTKQGFHVKFHENDRVIAEADVLLENGDYAMPVEVKTELTAEHVDEHLERIAVIRGYFDARDDKRKLVGAVAGGVIGNNVLKYAHRQGLYAIIQSGDSVAIADMPEGFVAREW